MSGDIAALAGVDELARRQLDAYNRADLEAFCACYHPEVTVIDHRGQPSTVGMEAFRAGYGAMFAANRDVFAEVTERLLLPPHVVERERWARVDRATGVASGGQVLVRYTAQDGLIRWVEFLKA